MKMGRAARYAVLASSVHDAPAHDWKIGGGKLSMMD
jgi:hypothetical protein